MARQLLPVVPTQPGPGARPLGAPAIVSLHNDPATGRSASWRVTPVADAEGPATFLVERIDGERHGPALRVQMQRHTSFADENDLLDLVRVLLADA